MDRYQLFLRNLIMVQMLLHNTDPGNPGGGGGGQDPAAAFQRLLDQNKNDGLAVASKLFDENFQLRTKNRDLSAKLPKDGAVVLTDDDAKEWNAFKALNVKAADAKKAVESIPALEKQNKELSGMESLRELADLGLDGSKLKLSVLKEQLASKFPDAEIAFRTEKDKDGKEAKVAYLKKDKDSKEQSFTEFANAELVDYLPSLKVSTEAQQQPYTGNTPDPKPNNTATSVFDRIRDEQKTKNEVAKPQPGMDLNSRFGRPAAA
jgi:hypothetical protein